MKIVCDNCATKYSIADEKVRGKVFKIRCKKCSHIIVVKGTEGDAAADAGGAAAEAPAESAEAAGDGWHVVVNGEQVGPLSSQEVRGKFSAGEIDAETFAWKEGFGDWQRLASIDEFSDLQAAAPAAPSDSTRRSGAPGADDLFGGNEATTTGNTDLFGSSGGDLFAGTSAPAASGGGLFAQSAAEPAPAPAPAPAARRSPTPGFGAPAMDSVAPPQAAAPAAGGKLTGQRNENSVLFSLNNLQALASGGPAKSSGASAAPAAGVENRPGFANSQTEGSGLIDIRAMAAATLSTAPTPSASSSNNDLPSFSSAPVFSPIAAPILMPAASSGPPKWVWPLVGVGGLAFVAMVVVAVVLLTRKPEPVAVAPAAAPTAAAPAAAPTAATPTPAAANPGAAAPAAAAAAAPAVAAAAPAAADHHHGSAHGAKSTAPVKGGKAEAAPAPSAPVAAAAPAPAPKRKGKDDLDDLLNGATSSDKPSRSRESAPADDNLPDQLDKQAIVSGMNSVKPAVGACKEGQSGVVNVQVTIAKSGRVSNANVTGSFAGTPTGACVAKAVKGASFGKFKGAPQTITYPFMLR